MPDAPAGWALLRHETLDSTNSEGLRLLTRGFPGKTAILAERQALGRGCRDKVWESAGPQGLWVSLLLTAAVPGERLAPAAMILGIAVREAVGICCDVRLRTKWPNDLMADDRRKCCGLLVETGAASDVAGVVPLVLGIGLNVNHLEEDFPPDLAGKVVSLRMLSGREYDRLVILAAILRRADDWFERWGRDGFGPAREAWLADNDTLGREILLPEGYSAQRGTAVDLTPDGFLLVRAETGEILRVDAGEIAFARVLGG
jgi:BirA family biotin operon repressor/biotin-[acetyl-CoA-carboxylase] ligase